MVDRFPSGHMIFLDSVTFFDMRMSEVIGLGVLPVGWQRILLVMMQQITHWFFRLPPSNLVFQLEIRTLDEPTHLVVGSVLFQGNLLLLMGTNLG